MSGSSSTRLSYSASYIGYAFGTRSTKPNSSWSRLASPSCSSSRMPSWTRSSSSMFHSSSPAKQKNSRPTHAFVGVRHHPRAPGAEVLDPAHVHVRVVDVDPVVREEVLAVQHHGHGEEVAVAHPLRRGDHLGPRVRARHADRVSQRQRRDHGRRLEHLVAHVHAHAAVVLEVELGDLVVQEHLAAELLDVVGHRLPHLAGAVAGVVELRDQARDLVVLVPEERGPGGAEEREVLDPLGGPVGADLGRGHAPDLLRVGLEELVEEPAAEAVRRPTPRRWSPCPSA